MALDETAKIANVRFSLKKYLVDNIARTENIRVSFDQDLMPPEKQGVPFDEWLSVNYLTSDPGSVSSQMVRLICCRRKDAEGGELDGMRDIIMGYISDNVNKVRRIPLYNKVTKIKVGTMMLYVDSESGQQYAEDRTKFWIISITLKWGSII